MHTLLGPHLLDHWKDLAKDVREALKKWCPPVCVVFMDDVFKNDLSNQVQYPTHKSITDLMHRKTGYYRSMGQVRNNMEDYSIRSHIRSFNHSDLVNTKLVGRIYIDDRVVEAHIREDPDLTATFHHWLVKAARHHLGTLASRVNYWVILNEKLGGNQGDLRQLGQYETKRMELAGTEYGCGLYAFANANPPLFGAPAGANADFDKDFASATGLPAGR